MMSGSQAATVLRMVCPDVEDPTLPRRRTLLAAESCIWSVSRAAGQWAMAKLSMRLPHAPPDPLADIAVS